MSNVETDTTIAQTQAIKRLSDQDVARIADKVYRLLLEEVQMERRSDRFTLPNRGSRI